MRKLNGKGFTLIELLAVITIMGILMLVAIPAVSRTIENTRRDTFVSTAKSYINAMKNSVAADEIYVGSDPISAKGAGCYYYGFDTEANNGQTATELMEQGGKSSWGNAHVKGYIAITKTVSEDSNGVLKTRYEYSIFMVDAGKHGIPKITKESELRRTAVMTNTDNVVGKTAPSGVEEQDKLDGTTLKSEGEGACTLVTIG